MQRKSVKSTTQDGEDLRLKLTELNATDKSNTLKGLSLSKSEITETTEDETPKKQVVHTQSETPLTKDKLISNIFQLKKDYEACCVKEKELQRQMHENNRLHNEKL